MTKHVAKRPRTINSKSFYGTAARVGGKVAKYAAQRYIKHKVSNAGKRLFNTARKVTARFLKSRSNSDKRSLPDIIQQGSQHNDWAKRPLGRIVISNKTVPKTVGKFFFEHSYGRVLEGAQGVQLVNTGNYMLTKTQLGGTTTGSLSNFVTSWATDPFQLNPYSTAPNNAIYTGVPAAVVADDKLCIKSIKHILRIVSLCTVPQRVKVLYFLCKKDGDATPSTIWSEAISASAYLQASQASGPTNSGSSAFTAGYTSSNVVGEVPHKWPTFRKFWKLVHSDQFMLQGGDQMSVPVNIEVNKVITKQMLSSMTTSDVYISGLSIIPMIIVDAGLTGISSSVTTDANTCAPGYARIGVLATEKYTFGAMPVNRFTIERNELGYVRQDVTVGEVFKIINDVDTAVAETKS